jgi:hypothetical protein
VGLSGLSPAVINDYTETAQRFLASACDTVDDVLTARLVIRNANRATAGKGAGGAPSGSEQDMLRAAIVFSGARLDATLKQLIRDALPTVIAGVSDAAEAKFQDFVTRNITANSDAVRPAEIARLLTSPSPREELVSRYVYDLTGSSLQSRDQVFKIAAALGVSDRPIKDRKTELGNLFTARNQVAHELDLNRVREPGDRTRRIRRVGETEALCQTALETAQQMVNLVTALLR